MSTHYLSSFFAGRNQSVLTKILIAALWLFPLAFFLLHGWADILSYVIAFCAVILLWQTPKLPRPLSSISLWVIVALSATFLAILMSSTLRGQFLPPMFDGPTRYLLAIPIFFIIKQKEINFSRIFEYTCPIMLLLFACQASIHPLYRDARLIAPTLYDPNLVGVYTTTFAFMCLTSLQWQQDSGVLKMLKIIGIAAGIALSCFSESRSGWSAGIALIIFWLGLHYRHMTLKNIGLALIAVFCLVFIFYHVDVLHHRIQAAIQEVLAWSSGANKDTSSGIRLTMWLIALRLFSMHPWQGYSDHHLASYFSDPYIAKIGTPVALFTMQHVGPHNDLLQNMVLAGVWGLIAVLLVIFVPLILLLRIYMNSPNSQAKKACAQGLCLVIGIFVGGFFSITLGLKMSVTFYALVVYGLLATALWQQQK